MSKIYEKLNYIVVESGETDLTKIEELNLEKLVKSYSKKKKNSFKYLLVAASVILIFTLSIPKTRAAVNEAINNVLVTISEAFRFELGVDEYAEILHKEIEIGDRTFYIEGVLLDENRVYLNLLLPEDEWMVKKDGIIDENSPYPSLDYMLINGEKYEITGNLQTINYDKEFLKDSFKKLESIDENLVSFTGEYHLDRLVESTSDLDVELHFLIKSLNDENVDLSDQAIVSFTASIEKLLSNTYKLVDSFEIPESNGILVEYVKFNEVEQRIELKNLNNDFIIGDEDFNVFKNYKLLGVNKDGQEINFIVEVVSSDIIQFRYGFYNEVTIREFLEDIEEINFKLYIIENGKSNQIGKDFKLPEQ